MPRTKTHRDERIAEGKTDYGRVKYPEFSERVQKAMDSNPEVPPPHYGRLSWMTRAFENKFGATVTTETVRKWIEGISEPRAPRRGQLAEVLGVDEGWLLGGGPTPVDRKERRLRNAEVDGAVNLVAGLIQMDGGNPAFPGATPRDAARDGVDLYAVIRGGHYALSITTAVTADDATWSIPVPSRRDELMVLAIVRRDGFTFDILEIDEEAIAAHGTFVSGSVHVPVRKEKGVYLAGGLGLKQVKSFAERL